MKYERSSSSSLKREREREREREIEGKGKILKQTVHYPDSVLMSSTDKVIFSITALLFNLQTSCSKPQAAITKGRQTKRHHEWNLINLFLHCLYD